MGIHALELEGGPWSLPEAAPYMVMGDIWSGVEVEVLG